MDRRFEAEEWTTLGCSERINRCQIMAAEAMKLAKTASPNQADGYMLLAEQWLRLAAEISREANTQ